MGDAVECPHCWLVYYSKGSLTKHINAEHWDITPCSNILRHGLFALETLSTTLRDAQTEVKI